MISKKKVAIILRKGKKCYRLQNLAETHKAYHEEEEIKLLLMSENSFPGYN